MPDEDRSGLSAELQAAMQAALSIKSQLIPFWRESPTAWFAHFETVIEPQHKSDQQKYICLLRQLQEQDLRHVADILKNPPGAGKFKALKERLIAVYEETSVQRYQKLVSGLSLGDQKPTQLLRQMRDLASGILTDSGLKIEWFRHLPAHMRTVLSANSEDSLDALAMIADRIMDYETPAGANLSEVSHKVEQGNSDILQRIDALTSEVAALRAAREPSRANSVSRSRAPFPRYPSRERVNDTRTQQHGVKDDDICWYHKTFRSRARRCERPCKYYRNQGNLNRHQ